MRKLHNNLYWMSSYAIRFCFQWIVFFECNLMQAEIFHLRHFHLQAPTPYAYYELWERWNFLFAEIDMGEILWNTSCHRKLKMNFPILFSRHSIEQDSIWAALFGRIRRQTLATAAATTQTTIMAIIVQAIVQITITVIRWRRLPAPDHIIIRILLRYRTIV